jgi:hypothetical protein
MKMWELGWVRLLYLQVQHESAVEHLQFSLVSAMVCFSSKGIRLGK